MVKNKVALFRARGKSSRVHDYFRELSGDNTDKYQMKCDICSKTVKAPSGELLPCLMPTAVKR